MSVESIKCVLIDPPNMPVGLSEEEAKEQSPCYPPIGLAYIAAVLRENGVKVKIIDARSLRMSLKEVSKCVEKEQPDLVGITVFTPQIRSVLMTCKETKKVCPTTKIVVGGPHVRAEHQELVKNDSIDFCVRGEGENTMLELVNALSNGMELGKVKGISFKNGKDIIVTPDRPFIQNLDTLPFPARDLLPNHIYKGLVPFPRNEKYTMVVSSRGCPFKCRFCQVPQFLPNQRRRSVENVIEELEHVYEKYKIRCVRFNDEMFVLNKKWLFEFCNQMVERGLNEEIMWSCDTRVDVISEDALREIKNAGCRHLFYGIEFGNQRILDFSGKGTTIAQIHRAIEMTKNAGISIEGNFMMGYPTETKETIEETIILARSLDVDYKTFSLVTPFPGTQLYKYCDENNLLRSRNWEEYNYFYVTKTGGAIKLQDVSKEELVELFIRAHNEFYCTHQIDKFTKDIFGLIDHQKEIVKELNEGITQIVELVDNRQQKLVGGNDFK